MAILAIDFGSRRIGLAVADSLSSPAYPIGTLKRKSLREDLDQVARAIDGRGVTQLVVGLPLNMNGSEGPIARAARKFGDQLGAHLDLSVDYADERLTSVEARERLSAQGGMRGKKAAVDALAAAIILEDWLTTHRNPS
ncbi:MAG TPA: Holliday junction resolvase RuvX [Candidatus Binataceae bacterium]|nr:Holliday junction resolvase RuvX [Candidatus Binataceae bacterium]